MGKTSGAKVFGIGLSRTGTTSLNSALWILGYRAFHYPQPILNIKKGRAGLRQHSVLDDYDAFTDTPVALLYKELDKKYPGSKFILTVRDMDGWLKSCRKFFAKKSEKVAGPFIRKKLYNSGLFNEAKFRKAYENHTGDVMDYFKGREDDLCVMDICKGDGWEKLCPFLGKDIPKVSFSWHNIGKYRIYQRIFLKIKKKLGRYGLAKKAMGNAKKMLKIAGSGKNSIIRQMPFLHKRYFPAKDRIGLEITNACNIKCKNCESSSAQAPSNEQMSVEQVRRFVDESIGLGWKWKVIKLRGGEPTLHPDFFEILGEIERYCRFNPECEVSLSTNGCGKKAEEVLKKLPSWVKVFNSKEHNFYAGYISSYNSAPADLLAYRIFADFSKGCRRTEKCNMGLTRYGYYPCSPGASVDRVFGFDIGIKRLSDVKGDMRDKLSILCRHCGHYKEPNEIVKNEKISESWAKAYKKYKKSKPKLSLY